MCRNRFINLIFGLLYYCVYSYWFILYLILGITRLMWCFSSDIFTCWDFSSQCPDLVWKRFGMTSDKVLTKPSILVWWSYNVGVKKKEKKNGEEKFTSSKGPCGFCSVWILDWILWIKRPEVWMCLCPEMDSHPVQDVRSFSS